MRRVCSTVALLSAILWPSGCNNRPPKNLEEFRIPPGEQRYVDTPQTPKEYLNQDPGNPYKSGGSGMPGGGTTPGGMSRPGSRPGAY